MAVRFYMRMSLLAFSVRSSSVSFTSNDWLLVVGCNPILRINQNPSVCSISQFRRHNDPGSVVSLDTSYVERRLPYPTASSLVSYLQVNAPSTQPDNMRHDLRFYIDTAQFCSTASGSQVRPAPSSCPRYADRGLFSCLLSLAVCSGPGLDNIYMELGLTYTDKGIMIVGTPVGTDSYIEECLDKQARDALRILKDIQEASMIGTLHSPWMDPQGLYHLVRDCANQVLRHLLRTVDPALTTLAFEQVDKATLELVAQIFNICGPDLSPTVRARIVLPRSMTGLGVREYVMEAPRAFIGCIARVVPTTPAEQVPYIAPYEHACGLLRDDVPTEKIPTLDDLLPSAEGDHLNVLGRNSLASKLMEHRYTKLWHQTTANASGPERHFLQKASLSHAGDFLSGSLRDHACRMFSQFEPVVRLYLGVPVTPDRCFIGQCDVRRGDSAHIWCRVIRQLIPWRGLLAATFYKYEENQLGLSISSCEGDAGCIRCRGHLWEEAEPGRPRQGISLLVWEGPRLAGCLRRCWPRSNAG